MKRVGRSFFAQPAWAAGALLTFAALAAIGWYLGSPLFVRTYRYESPPSAITGVGGSTGSSTEAATAATTQPSAALRVLRSGELGYVDAIHHGEGPVRIVEIGGEYFVRFEDVMLTNAPDVHVYLSRETGGKWDEATSLYIGALKATNGSFNYVVPPGADVASFQSVVVWCRAFRVLITWADLGTP